ncbi:MAG: hypothetical protein M5U26_12480 [Planctomycetota bacterium]|nr:hypothetical protein [Planctomycetota bacterium]
MNRMRGPYGMALAGLLLSVAPAAWSASVTLRLDLPPGGGAATIPVRGGVPFPKGALDSAEHVRLLAGGKELPAQVSKAAVWPDGSVKWVLVDAVVDTGAVKDLTLEFGAGISRAAVNDGLTAQADGDGAAVEGPGLRARAGKASGAVLDELTLGGKPLFTPQQPLKLVLDTARIENGTAQGGSAFPAGTYLSRDEKAGLDRGQVALDEIAVEEAGPIRATLRLRGKVKLAHFGATLPAKIKEREGAGELPFSLRLSFFRGAPIVYGQHQIVFSGEPDCDFIARWGLELPGQGAANGTLVLEPGLELNGSGEDWKPAAEASRLCFAPLKSGLALIRDGWQERPCGVVSKGGAAFVEFWPEAAGLWDLRRYAREWAVGESGNMRKPEDMKRYAALAARGIAKSHRFVLDFGGKAELSKAKALAGRAVLVAPPGWYGASEALGPLAPEQTAGAHAKLDAATRRELDFHLYCQDLYRWHGKLTYGYWQSRFGETHRHDRWDDDYGRWGWALNDGAGRIGHILMLAYLRTGERRYLEAGDAFNRVCFDTNMVHTRLHYENTEGLWTATGCSHRHNVQPFGCPYIGMRGSYPVGQRMLHLLTGDGVIADGLEIVADASFRYVNGEGSRLCNSGGSDGQGSASNALLWKHETTGERKYLDACRKILDQSGLVPPAPGKGLGYGPSFGLFNAAGEYADLSGDEGFRKRVIELGKQGIQAKNASAFIYAIAMAYRYSKDEALKTKLNELLAKLATERDDSLAALPESRWPGHAGWRTPDLRAGETRDYPYALGVLLGDSGPGSAPKLTPSVKPAPAAAPERWYRPGGAQQVAEKVPAAAELLALKPGDGGGALKAGDAAWSASKSLADAVEVNGAKPLAGPLAAYVALAAPKDGLSSVAAKYTEAAAAWDAVGPAGEGVLAATGSAGPAQFAARLRIAQVDGLSALRVEAACRVRAGSGQVAHWGLRLPLALGKDGHALMATAPGAFRLERCRLNQNDEKIPSWLTAMEGRESLNHWPLWRRVGLEVLPGGAYRVWHAAEDNVVPLYVDQGFGTANWLDVTDRGVNPRWGVTARVLRPAEPAAALGLRLNFESGVLEIQFHAASAAPLSEAAAAAGLAGAADLLVHDGWRPPLSKPELSAAQWEKFAADLDYGENVGLNALRFCLSETHKVKGAAWLTKLRDLGLEPREILYGMQRGDGLKSHCAKLGVSYDEHDLEGSIQRVLAHYRK